MLNPSTAFSVLPPLQAIPSSVAQPTAVVAAQPRLPAGSTAPAAVVAALDVSDTTHTANVTVAYPASAPIVMDPGAAVAAAAYCGDSGMTSSSGMGATASDDSLSHHAALEYLEQQQYGTQESQVWHILSALGLDQQYTAIQCTQSNVNVALLLTAGQVSHLLWLH